MAPCGQVIQGSAHSSVSSTLVRCANGCSAGTARSTASFMISRRSRPSGSTRGAFIQSLTSAMSRWPATTRRIAAAVRLDESLPHVALQLGELLGDSRRCQVQRRSGAGHGTKGRHRMESLKALKVQHFTKSTQYFELYLACA